jgi:hypothetical protein
MKSDASTSPDVCKLLRNLWQGDNATARTSANELNRIGYTSLRNDLINVGHSAAKALAGSIHRVYYDDDLKKELSTTFGTLVSALARIPGEEAAKAVSEALEYLTNEWGSGLGLNEHCDEYRLFARHVSELVAIGEPSVDRLISVLDFGQKVACGGAIALGSIGAKRAAQPLIKLSEQELTILQQDPSRSDDLHKCTVWALGEIGDPSAIENLIKVVKLGRLAAAKYAAVSLGRIRSPLGVGFLRILFTSLLSGQIRRVDFQRADSLSRQGLISCASKFAVGEATALKEAVAYALGQAGDVESFDLFVQALGDTEESVRYTASRILAKMQDPRVVKVLKDALTTKELVGLLESDIIRGKVDCLKNLIKAGVPLNDAIEGQYAGGMTPLQLAVFQHNVRVVEILLSVGADPNATSTYVRSTPLALCRPHFEGDPSAEEISNLLQRASEGHLPDLSVHSHTLSH